MATPAAATTRFTLMPESPCSSAISRPASRSAARVSGAASARAVNLGQSAGAEASVDMGLIRHSHLKLTGLSGASLTPEQSAAGYAQVAEFAVAGKMNLAIESDALDDVAAAWSAQASSPGRKIVVRP
ncbi:MAG TPA: hypothetical protein VGX23_19235 [Actinocrinis sp.]|nr:hypothetical protein [Actinocrinis sp.]